MNPAAAGHGKGPKSTPLVAGGRVFALGIGGILSAYDATSGKRLWRHDYQERFKATSPLYGSATSPIADGDRVFAHFGGQGDGALIALDAATGAERWAWHEDGPGYASPVIAEIGGVRQLVTETQGLVVGISVDRGETLWKVPFTTAFDQNAVTPVVAGDLVIYSGVDKGVHALRVSKRGAQFTTSPAWDNDQVSNYMSTPVLQGGVLYGLSHKKKGQLFALDAQTGRTLWLSEGRLGDNAALVAAEPVLLILTTEGVLIVAKQDRGAFSVLRSYTVADSPTWAHPAIQADLILVKDKDSASLWKVR
jgi:outer membrane protein assembly factor BamB